MVEKIKCKSKHSGTGGCGVCGGYGYLIAKQKVCTECGLEGWVRPGSWTSYEGKRWNTFDGITMTQHFRNETSVSLCPKCEAK